MAQREGVAGTGDHRFAHQQDRTVLLVERLQAFQNAITASPMYLSITPSVPWMALVMASR